MIAPPPAIDAALEHAAAVTHIPVALLRAVAWTESRYQPRAVSKVGALGLMQLMPGNLKPFGVTDPFDARQSALGAARMLSSLHDQLGDWGAVLAAYNWGIGNVRAHPSSSSWPTSVNKYVDKVLAAFEASPVLPTRGGNTAPRLLGFVAVLAALALGVIALQPSGSDGVRRV